MTVQVVLQQVHLEVLLPKHIVHQQVVQVLVVAVVLVVVALDIL